MKELNIGTTTIPTSEIDQLQRTLRNCKISYTTYVAPLPVKEKINLGNIYFEKGMITSQSRRLLDQTGEFLIVNKNAAIILEAKYTSSASQKNIIGYVKQVVNYFEKMGVTEKSGQITENITEAPQQQQILKRTQKQEQSQEFIQMKGVNFPANFNTVINKSAN